MNAGGNLPKAEIIKFEKRENWIFAEQEILLYDEEPENTIEQTLLRLWT